jgi:hypothetical protein
LVGLVVQLDEREKARVAIECVGVASASNFIGSVLKGSTLNAKWFIGSDPIREEAKKYNGSQSCQHALFLKTS